MEEVNILYTTVGRLRGCCNHEHDEFLDAQKCLLEHQKKMRALGQITDRIVLEVESLEELEEDLELY